VEDPPLAAQDPANEVVFLLVEILEIVHRAALALE
jgi:hypothetical protein